MAQKIVLVESHSRLGLALAKVIEILLPAQKLRLSLTCKAETEKAFRFLSRNRRRVAAVLIPLSAVNARRHSVHASPGYRLLRYIVTKGIHDPQVLLIMAEPIGRVSDEQSFPHLLSEDFLRSAGYLLFASHNGLLPIIKALVEQINEFGSTT